MLAFPCCKINLGLNVVERRPDGYHNIETVFFPIPLCDALEIDDMNDAFPATERYDLQLVGHAIEGRESDNLVVRAYQLLAENYPLPRIHIHLCKRIPSQAGLGGGSSDAASMLRLLSEHCRLGLSTDEMRRYAARLGADCPFFVEAKPVFATGIGDRLIPADSLADRLKGYYAVIVKPDIAVSTADAYRAITPRRPAKSCCTTVQQPIGTWRDELSNDFEQPAFAAHPRLADIRQRLYRLGAAYAQMSGSGSALFGIFVNEPAQIAESFPDDFTFVCRL